MSRPLLSRRRLLTAAGALGLYGQVSAQTVGARNGVGGWREAVVIVPDPEPWISTLITVGGWETAYRGAPNASLNAFWGLPKGATTEQVLMRNIGTDSGFLRLVRVRGAEQQTIRPDDQAWECGGVQALDLRVVSIEATRAALHARGWHGPSDPVRYKAYGGLEVIQWAPSSPDGVRLSFIQRIAPPLQGWPELKRWGRATNAAITVGDMAAAQAFFSGILGMTAVSSTNTVGGDGPNVMGLPWQVARRALVDIRGFGGASVGDGTIELISIPDARGREFSTAAQPPNMGLAALRIFVQDAQRLAVQLTTSGASPSQIFTTVVAPYGLSRVFAVTGAEGVRIEFIEARSDL